MVSAPVSTPIAFGTNTTASLHWAPGASDVPQVFSRNEKSPLTYAVPIGIAAVPEFVTVTD
jgi:hypothetical protein